MDVVTGVVVIGVRIDHVIGKQGDGVSGQCKAVLGKGLQLVVIVGKFEVARDGIHHVTVTVKIVRVTEYRGPAGDIELAVTASEHQFAGISEFQVHSGLSYPAEFRAIAAVAFQPGTEALGEKAAIVPHDAQTFGSPVTVPEQRGLLRFDQEVRELAADDVRVGQP